MSATNTNASTQQQLFLSKLDELRELANGMLAGGPPESTATKKKRASAKKPTSAGDSPAEGAPDAPDAPDAPVPAPKKKRAAAASKKKPAAGGGGLQPVTFDGFEYVYDEETRKVFDPADTATSVGDLLVNGEIKFY